MSLSVGEIRINLSAGTSQFVKDLEKAKGNIKEFSSHAKGSANEAKGAMALLGEELGISLPRHARNFLAELPGISTAMNAAFSSVAVIAIGVAVIETGKKIAEFFNKVSEGKAKSEEAWRSFSRGLKDSNDETDLSIARLNAETAKLTGKHENTLAITLDEARVNADKLAASLDTDLAKLSEILKTQNVGFFAQLFGNQASTKGNAEGADRFREQVADADGDAKKIKDSASGEIQRLTTKLDSTKALQKRRQAALSPKGDVTDGSGGSGSGASGDSLIEDQSGQIKQLQEQLNQAKRVQHAASNSLDLDKAQADNAKAKAAKDAAQAAKEATEAKEKALKKSDEDGLGADSLTYKANLGELIKYWESRLAAESQYKTRSEEITHELVRLHQESSAAIARVAERGKKVAEENAAKAKAAAKEYENLVQEGQRIGEKIGTDKQEHDAKMSDANASGRANSAEAELQAKKLATERAYGLELLHTKSQQITYMTTMAGFDAAEMAAKEATLETELATAKVLGDELAIKKAQNALDKQKAIDANAQYEAVTKILEVQNQATGLSTQKQIGDSATANTKQTLQQWSNFGTGNMSADIQKTLMSLPQELGSTLSHVFSRHQKGDSVGKDIANVFKNAGKQLFGELLTGMIQKLVAEMAVNVLGLSLQTTVTSAQLSATIANTVALGIMTDALFTQMALLGFADGTDSAPGGLAWVGERGPELMNVPRGSQIVPNHKVSDYLKTASLSGPGAPQAYPTSGSYSMRSSSVNPSGDTNQTFNGGNHTFHIHEASDPKETARVIAKHLKNSSPSYSPYSK
jgi:hypothetical protein